MPKDDKATTTTTTNTTTIGWLKDSLAAVAFLGIAVALARLPAGARFLSPRVVAAALVVPFSVDAAFSASPHWHCMPVGRNAPTAAVALAVAVPVVAVACVLLLAASSST